MSDSDHMGGAMRKRFFGHMRTAKDQIRLRIRTVWSGPSLSANRIIGHCGMYEWWAKARIILFACEKGVNQGTHLQADVSGILGQTRNAYESHLDDLDASPSHFWWLGVKGMEPTKRKETSRTVRKRTSRHEPPMRTLINLHFRAVWSVFIVHMKKPCILGYPICAQWRFWTDCESAGC